MPQTGPRTPNGKAKASRNAWKHGILSVGIVLNETEDEPDWQAHLAGTFESLNPEGHLEHLLAERIAICLWKLRRVDFYLAVATGRFMAEARADIQFARAYREGTLASGEFPEVTDAELVVHKASRILPPKDELEKVMRYEGHLHRQYIQTLHELEAMQARRRGERTPLARFDVAGSPTA